MNQLRTRCERSLSQQVVGVSGKDGFEAGWLSGHGSGGFGLASPPEHGHAVGVMILGQQYAAGAE